MKRKNEKKENKIDTSNTSKQYTIEELLELGKEQNHIEIAETLERNKVKKEN